jgi:Chitobiase/beta-hexosaminidase C-terminal domain
MSDHTPPITTSNIPLGWNGVDSFIVQLTAVDYGDTNLDTPSGFKNTYYTTDNSDPATSITRFIGPNLPTTVNDFNSYLDVGANISTGTALTITAGTFPFPLQPNVTYYAINKDSTHIQLATSFSNATSHIAILITTPGFGVAVNAPNLNVYSNITQFVISTQGSTPINYFSVDNNGNTEQTKTDFVKLDSSLPVSNYSAEIAISNEVIVSSAQGGETDFFLHCSDIVPNSYTIKENNVVVLTYALNTYNGHLHLATGLSPSDELTASYSSYSFDGSDGWYKTNPTITLSASSAAGIVATFYRWDSDPFELYSSSFNIPNEGVHTLQFYSQDNAGNVESARSVFFKLDNTPPVSTDDAPLSLQTQPVTVNLFSSDDASGVANTYYTIDGSIPTTDSSSGTSVVFSATGSYNFQYFSVDFAGNQETPKSIPVNVFIDTQIPQVYISENFPINGKNGWYTVSPLITLAAVGPSGVKEILYKLYPANKSTTARYTSTINISATVDLSQNYLINIEINQITPSLQINLQGVIPSQTTIVEIIDAINTTFGSVIATQTDQYGNAGGAGFVTITSPTASLGNTTAQVVFLAPTSNDATAQIFGLDETLYPHIFRETILFEKYTSPLVLSPTGLQPALDGLWQIDYYAVAENNTMVGIINSYDSGSGALSVNVTNTTGYGAYSAWSISTQINVTAGSFVTGTIYTISFLGTTDFTLIGASSNTVGLTFVATGVGSGTGTAIVTNTTFSSNSLTIDTGVQTLIAEIGLNFSAGQQVNIANTSAIGSKQYKLDLTAPSTFTINSALSTGNNNWYTANPKIAFNPTDNLSGILRTFFQWDDGIISEFSNGTMTGSVLSYDTNTGELSALITTITGSQIYDSWLVAYNIEFSNDSLTIGTGPQNLTVSSGLSLTIGELVTIFYDNDNQMSGTVFSYNPTTGALTINISSATGVGNEFSVWNVLLPNYGTTYSSDSLGVSTGIQDLFVGTGLSLFSGEKIVIAPQFAQIPNEGTHTLKVYSVDIAGNTETTQNFTYKLSQSVPITTDNTAFYQGIIFSATGTGIQQVVGEDSTVLGSYQIQAANPNVYLVTSVYNVTKSHHNSGPFSITGIDSNIVNLANDGTPFSVGDVLQVTYYSYDVNTDPKTLNIANYVLNPQPIAHPFVWNWDANIRLYPSDKSTNSVQATYYTYDGSTPTTNSLVYNPLTGINLTESGIYTFKYFSVNLAGQAESVKTANEVVIDKLLPSLSINFIPSIPDGSNGWYKNAFQIQAQAWSSDTKTNYDEVPTVIGTNILQLSNNFIKSVQQIRTSISGKIIQTSSINVGTGYYNQIQVIGTLPVLSGEVFLVDYTNYIGINKVVLTSSGFVSSPITVTILNDITKFIGLKPSFSETLWLQGSSPYYSLISRGPIVSGSISITKNSNPLTLNTDYTFDYSSGKINYLTSILLTDVLVASYNQDAAMFGFTISPSLNDGIYTIHSQSYDDNSVLFNNHPQKLSLVQNTPFKLDRVLPVTTDNTTNVSWQKTFTVILTANDSSSNIAATYWSIDNFTTSHVYSTGIVLNTNGVYTVKYYSVDDAGNTEAIKTATYVVYIDNSCPITTISTLPSNPDGTNSWFITDPRIEFSAGQISGHSVVVSTWYKVNNASSFTQYSIPFLLAREGANTITFYSIDTLANYETPQIVTVDWDNIPPVTTPWTHK